MLTAGTVQAEQNDAIYMAASSALENTGINARDKNNTTLTPEDQKTFDTKFSHFTNQQYKEGIVIERDRSNITKEKDKKEAALEAVRELLSKRGYQAKDLFNKGE